MIKGGILQHTILIVDNEADNLKFQKTLLESKGYIVHQAPSARFAASLVRKNIGRYSLALVDYHMPEIMGDEATRLFHGIDRDLQVITISGDDSEEAFDTNLRAGSYLVLNRTISSSRLLSIVQNYCKKFEDRTGSLTKTISKSEAETRIRSFSMIGASKHLVEVCELIERYAKIDNSVLILGENGTGKERVAQSIHEKSMVAKGPFIPVNCGAINENLIEGELFGHVRGAFSGAMYDRKGHFREADGGTIFLDEIGEMPTSTQVKLLRVLQEQEVTPVGTSRPIKISVRVIAATNVDLEKAVESGRFRKDLFYRLNVLPIAIKPLRSRPEDIEPLVLHFLDQWKIKTGEQKEFRNNAIAAMRSYPWPGNVRELENVMTRLTAKVDGAIEHKHLEETLRLASDNPETLNLIEAFHSLPEEYKDKERRILTKIIEVEGSLSKGAKVLNMAKSTLHDRLKSLGIQLGKTLTEEKV